MSPFATVKTSKYGVYRTKERQSMWSEETWRLKVLVSLLGVVDISLRVAIAKLCSFRYTVNQLQAKVKA